jgi:site-specific recombinase XerD
MDGESRGLSPKTMSARAMTARHFIWWIHQNLVDPCFPDDIRRFIAYVASPDPEGRWGAPDRLKAASASTAATYYGRLRSFFRFLVEEERITVSPMQKIKAPVHRPDQITPFTETQIKSLLAAARAGRYPQRDEALVLFLLDTAIRASELCGLLVSDVDLKERHAIVHGKGGKQRTIFFSATTARAYNRFRATVRNATDDMPMFSSEQGGALTLSGVEQIVRRLGITAKLRGVRCSPHTFRNTACVMFLRAGGHVFALKEMLGHTTLTMTMRYAMIAQADVQAQHAQFSPVDHLKRRR